MGRANCADCNTGPVTAAESSSSSLRPRRRSAVAVAAATAAVTSRGDTSVTAAGPPTLLERQQGGRGRRGEPCQRRRRGRPTCVRQPCPTPPDGASGATAETSGAAAWHRAIPALPRVATAACQQHTGGVSAAVVAAGTGHPTPGAMAGVRPTAGGGGNRHPRPRGRGAPPRAAAAASPPTRRMATFFPTRLTRLSSLLARG